MNIQIIEPSAINAEPTGEPGEKKMVLKFYKSQRAASAHVIRVTKADGTLLDQVQVRVGTNGEVRLDRLMDPIDPEADGAAA